MHETWIAMLFIWGIVELIQFLRKRPFPERMRTGAFWALGLTTMIMVGQAPTHLDPSAVLGVSFAMCCVAVGIVYGIRLIARKLWRRCVGRTSTDRTVEKN